MERDAAERYHVPVRRAAVTVTLADGSRQDAVFFCGPGQAVADLLEGATDFLPIEHDGRVRLVARRTLAVVSMSRTNGVPAPGDEEPPPQRVCVAVRIGSGACIEGELVCHPRPERARTLDVLNEPTRMLRVHTADAIHLVSKEHVHSLEET